MSILSDARQALVEIPVSDVLRERLNLAFDRAAEFERQNTQLKSENESLKAKIVVLESQIQTITLDRDNARQEFAAQQKLASSKTHDSPIVGSNLHVTGHGTQVKKRFP